MDPFTLALTIGAIFNLAILINTHGRKVFVPRYGLWENPPPVYLHTGSFYTIDDVEEALAFWREKVGQEFGPIILTSDLRPVPGTILIRAGIREGVHGDATWGIDLGLDDEDFGSPEEEDREMFSSVDEIIKRDVSGRITGAEIAIDPAMRVHPKKAKLVLVHELGHAIGFGHALTAVLGRRKKDSKSGKKKKGDIRKFLGLNVVANKSGHVMNPFLSSSGWKTDGMVEEFDEDEG